MRIRQRTVAQRAYMEQLRGQTLRVPATSNHPAVHCLWRFVSVAPHALACVAKLHPQANFQELGVEGRMPRLKPKL